MTKRELAVAAAKDVIKQLKAGRYEANSTYLQAALDEEIDKIPACELKDKAICEVCGIGSMFLSLACIKGEKLDTNFDSQYVDMDLNEMIPTLLKAFSPKTLMLIEIAFEGDTINDDMADYGSKVCRDVDADHPTIQKAIKFYNRYGDEKRCLIGIANNIIKNKGEFIP